jgi:hypothetical protein
MVTYKKMEVNGSGLVIFDCDITSNASRDRKESRKSVMVSGKSQLASTDLTSRHLECHVSMQEE